MKITIVTSNYKEGISTGGAERSIRYLTQALHKDHQISIIALSPYKGIREEIIGSIPVIYVGQKNVYWHYPNITRSKYKKAVWHLIDVWNPWMGSQVQKVLTYLDPEIVHTNLIIGWSVSLWSAIKRLNLPIVHTLRDYYLICTKSALFRNGKQCHDQCLSCKMHTYNRRIASSRIDAVVGNSKYILNEHTKRGYFPKSTYKKVIYNGYKGPKDSLVTYPRNGQNSRFVFGFLGHISPHKGIEFLLKEFNTLRQDNWELLIGGDGDSLYLQSLQEQSSSEKIQFLGVVKTEDFFSRIDILIVPSIWPDPLPRVIFEAYTHGVPVIASNRGGNPEIIQIGKTGEIFNPDNTGELASIVNRIIGDKNGIIEMSNFALTQAPFFSAEKTKDEYLDLYHKVLGK